MMKWKIVIYFIAFTLFISISLSANTDTNITKAKAEANVEFGIDSRERRYYKPELNFYFPLNSLTLFVGAKYYQRTNSKLVGEIDYWLKTGLFTEIKENLELETALYHMCRHLTSHENSQIFDLNEILSRLWINSNKNSFGLGIGTYIGGSEKHENLLIFNSKFRRIFNTELSLNGEFKLVDLKKILHEIELSISVNKSFDFFLRNTKTYNYPTLTYMGLRIKSDGKAEEYIKKLKLCLGLYPFYENYKLGIDNEFKIEFFKTPSKRVLILAKSIVPILRGEKFLGTFWPEKMTYPLSIEYERKINDKAFLFGYCDYNINIPLDINKRFNSNLGAGLGIRNQPDFEMLKNIIRYEISGGYNFKNNLDFTFKFGINTLRKISNFASDISYKFDKKNSLISFNLFFSIKKEIEIRPFIKFEMLSYIQSQKETQNKFSIGIEFIKWFWGN